MKPRGVPYLVAEIGVNHDGDVDLAASMVRRVVACGFDAVKFQYWIEDELLSAETPSAPYQGAVDQRALLRPLELAIADLTGLRDLAKSLGLGFACTADGQRALDDVLTLEPDFLKVGSGDVDNPWLLDAVIAARLPVVISFGMATDAEVTWVIDRTADVDDLTVLHCVSSYPTPLASANLSRISWLSRVSKGRPVGYSDHTIGTGAAISAVTLGAVIVEKHVTHDVNARGPDHAASLPLDDARAWVTELRDVHAALAEAATDDVEMVNRRVVRKALYATRDLQLGSTVQYGDIEPKRPLFDGIPACDRDDVIGRTVARRIGAGERLTWGDFA